MTIEYKTVHKEMTSFCLGMIEYAICEQYGVKKENLQVYEIGENKKRCNQQDLRPSSIQCIEPFYWVMIS